MSKLLHGVPIHEWVGRMMKGQTQRAGRHAKARHTVKVIGFVNNGKLAEVHPSGHKGTELVELSELLPWWTRNNDLRIKYNVVDDGEMDKLMDDSARVQWETKFFKDANVPGHVPPVPTPPKKVASTHINKPLEPVITAPNPAKHPVKPSITPVESPDKPVRTGRGIKKIIVDPNASETWMDDLKDLKEAIEHEHQCKDLVAAAEKRLTEARDTVEEYAMAISGKGVTIEWDTPEPTPVVEEPVKKGQVRARNEHEIPEIDLARVRDFRARLCKQMVVGRKYNEEEIRCILQEHSTSTFKKILGMSFKDHQRLRRVLGGRHSSTVFYIVD